MAVSYPNPLRDFFPGPLVPPPSLRALGAIDVASYFVTTGDALQKLSFVEEEFRSYLVRLQDAAVGDDQSILEFTTEVEAALAAMPRYREALMLVRGSAVFLETSRDMDGYRIRPVNPKSKGEDEGEVEL